MRKVSMLLGAFLLSSIFMVPVQAADTQDITTTDGSKTQEGTVYGSLSGTALTQLKVTVPIKLEFAVGPVETNIGVAAPAVDNVVYNGDYKIKVAADSEVGVQLDNINIKKIGDWTLDTAASVANINVDKTGVGRNEKAKTVALKLGGKEILPGDTAFSADEFTVAISAEKSLGLSGTAGRVWLDKDAALATSKAFTITYTISQK